MRKFNVTVDGINYEVEVEEITSGVVAPVAQPAPVQVQTAKPVQQAQPQPAPAKKVSAPAGNGAPVKSPMPGNILKVLLSDGATVTKGQPILVLEAMKMENDIVADKDGVLTYCVKAGDSVETGATLATIA